MRREPVQEKAVLQEPGDYEGRDFWNRWVWRLLKYHRVLTLLTEVT